MVTSIVVNKEGRICVAYDSYQEGTPVSLDYAPDRKSLTLVMDNGQKTFIGAAAFPEISKRLEDSPQVLVIQIMRPDPSQQYEVPVHISALD